MECSDVRPIEQAEQWVRAAFAIDSVVDRGAFSLILEAAQEGCVIKLTRSEAAYKALVHFNGTNPHFARVFQYAPSQAQGKDGCIYHALLLEKIPEISPLNADALANLLHSFGQFRKHPLAVLCVARAIMKREVPGYPVTLGQALEMLGLYAAQNSLMVELNQPANWGRRLDGSLVLFDLVHSRRELN